MSTSFWIRILITALAAALFSFAASAQGSSAPAELVTASDLYWLTRLDPVRGACVVLIAAGLMGTFFAVMFAELESEKKSLRWLRLTIPLVLLGGIGAVFVPTTKEMIAIMVIPKIANNEDVQGLGADTVRLAREWLEELRPAAIGGAK